MFWMWTYDHEAILYREVVNINPYTTKGPHKEAKEYIFFFHLEIGFTFGWVFICEENFSYPKWGKGRLLGL